MMLIIFKSENCTYTGPYIYVLRSVSGFDNTPSLGGELFFFLAVNGRRCSSAKTLAGVAITAISIQFPSLCAESLGK